MEVRKKINEGILVGFNADIIERIPERSEEEIPKAILGIIPGNPRRNSWINPDGIPEANRRGIPGRIVEGASGEVSNAISSKILEVIIQRISGGIPG